MTPKSRTNVWRQSILWTSEQFWKFVTGILVALFGFVMMAYGLNDLDGKLGVTFALVGMAVDLAGFLAICLFVQCPSCGMRWLWAAMRNQDHRQWFNWLVAQRECPRCGYDPAKRGQK